MKSHNTLLKKIILLFISIFIPLTVMSILAINYSNQKLKSQILSSIDSNNQSYISQLNTSLDNIYINSYNLINQSNYRNFSIMYNDFSTYDKRTQVKLIQEQLSGLQISTPLIESTHAYFFNRNIIFHNTGYSYGTFHSLPEDSLKELKSLTQEKKLTYYYENPITNKQTLEFFIAPEYSDDYRAGITISIYELEKYLTKNAVYPGEGFLFDSKDSLKIENLPNSSQGKDTDFQKLSKQARESDSFLHGKIDGIDYHIFLYEIPSLTAQYIRLIPTTALLKNINQTPFLIGVFFLLIFLACILFFIGVYRLIHQPLYQLTTAFEELEEGNFSITIHDKHNADFAYLFQAFNNMTENLNHLIEQDYNQKLLLQKAELK